jgi:hypothetical protein
MTGFAKLEHDPGEAFMKLFVDARPTSSTVRQKGSQPCRSFLVCQWDTEAMP